MSIDKVRTYLEDWNLGDDIQEFSVSSATVELAAEALGVEPARIAKSLAFKKEEGCVLVVAAGDVKIDNAQFKATFGMKAKMLSAEETLAMTGHAVGGVCPFALPKEVAVYVDNSIKRFETVFPACGSSNSAIELKPDEVFGVARAIDWVDVTKPKI